MTDQTKREKSYCIDLQTPEDREVRRNRVTRLMSVIFTSAFILFGPAVFLAYWGSMFMSETAGRLAGLVGLAIGVERLARLVPSRMFIYNPDWAAYVTQNVLTGAMVPYGPGLHLSHWWEQRSREGNYSLKIITSSFTVDVVTHTALARVKGTYAYAISLPFITTAIGVEVSSVERAISAFIESFLTSRCASSTAETIRSTVVALNTELADEFMAAKKGHTAGHDDFESKYGFQIVGIVIENVALSTETQKARDALDKATILHSVAARLYGLDPKELSARLAAKTISMADYNKMLSRAMATSDDATIDINVIEADADDLLAAAAARFAKGSAS